MKRFSKSILGVTLLEIMLVLAVAAIVIVMSVRYYQSASASQQANSTLEEVQAITAAGDGIAQGTGTYVGVTPAAVTPMMPNNSLATPWGSTITITAPTPTGYTVSIPGTPQNVCAQLIARLGGASPKYTTITPATCPTGTSTVSYVFDSTK